MKLLIASNNAGKLREFKEILSAYYSEILTPRDLALSLEVEENGRTFEENALIKARAFAKAAHMDAMADDSGLCVDALDGAPGVYSARYAGDHGDDDANNQLLLKNLIGVPDEKRTARFVCCIALVKEDGTEKTTQAASEGRILRAPIGEGGFGYDCLFYCEQYGRSYAQLTPEEKNAISHRGKALLQMRALMETHA